MEILSAFPIRDTCFYLPLIECVCCSLNDDDSLESSFQERKEFTTRSQQGRDKDIRTWQFHTGSGTKFPQCVTFPRSNDCLSGKVTIVGTFRCGTLGFYIRPWGCCFRGTSSPSSRTVRVKCACLAQVPRLSTSHAWRFPIAEL